MVLQDVRKQDIIENAELSIVSSDANDTLSAQKDASLKTNGQGDMFIVLPRTAILNFSSYAKLFNEKSVQSMEVDLSQMSDHAYHEISRHTQNLLRIKDGNGFNRAYGYVLEIDRKMAYVPPRTLVAHPKGEKLLRAIAFFNTQAQAHVEIEDDLKHVPAVEETIAFIPEEEFNAA
jgi:hypothetical protein